MDKPLGHWIHFVDLKLKQDLNNRITDYHVTSEQWGLLNSIYMDEGLSQTALAQNTLKDQASVTRMLARLIEKGLVSKDYNSADKRSFSLRLTDQGRHLRNALLPYTYLTMNKALKGLSEEDINHFKVILKKVYRNLEDN